MPFVVYLANGDQNTAHPELNQGPTSEVALPLRTYLRGGVSLSKPAALLERARDLVKLPAFCQLAGDVSGPPPDICGALDTAMPRRVIVVDRLPQPEVAAPLGWSLSQSSRNALNDAIDAQVKARCDGRSSPPSCRLGYAPLGDLRTTTGSREPPIRLGPDVTGRYLVGMSSYGQQPPYGQNPPNPYGQQQPGPYAQPQQYGQPPAGRQQQPPYPGQQGPYGQQPGQYPPQQPYGQPGQYGQPQQWTPQPPATRQPAIVERPLPVVTMETVPGREISVVVGDVVGVVARTRELRPDLRGLNPLDGYVVMLTDSRQDAVARMVEMAVAAGADAVVGLKFDCSEITQSLSEVAAYGTAVKLVPGDEDAADVGTGEQSNTATESSDQLETEEDTMRNWPPPSPWPSNQPEQQSAGSAGDQRQDEAHERS